VRRPPQKIVLGGEEHLAEAQNRLREMKRLAGPMGTRRQFWLPEGEGGPRVEMLVSPGVDRIIIDGETMEILSGLTDGSSIEQVPVAGSNPPSEISVLRRFYPSSLQAAGENQPREWRDERRLAVEAIAENVRIPGENTVKTFAQTANVSPAMFTGKMCKVAQLAMGLTLKAIPFEHSFYKTHGIYTAVDKALWLVEISLSNGIIATLLPVSKTKLKNKDMMAAVVAAGVPAIPTGAGFPLDLPKGIQGGQVRVLMRAAELTEKFYAGRNSFYGDCGWAFSESGSLAMNTSWNYIDDDDYIHSYLHQISISGDESGPTSAALVLTSQGILWNNSDSTHFYVPSGVSSDIITFPMKKAGFIQEVPGENWGGPLHAFFVGEAPQIYRQKSPIQSTPVADGMWQPYDPWAPERGRVANVFSGTGFTMINKDSYEANCSKEEGGGREGVIDFEGPGIGEAYIERDWKKTTRSTKAERTGPFLGERYERVDSEPSLPYPYNSRYYRFTYVSCFLGQETISVMDGSMAQNSLVISPKNRSCVFIGRIETKPGSSKTENRYTMGIGVAVGEQFQDRCENDETAPGNYGDWSIVRRTGSWGAGQGDFVYKVVPGSFGPGAAEFPPRYAPSDFVSFSGGRPSAVSTSLVMPAAGDGATAEYNVTSTYSAPSHGNDSESTRTDAPATGNGITTLNHGVSAQQSYTTPSELIKFTRVFSLSPDLAGTFATIHSGRSAFLNSTFHSKNQGEISGAGLQVSPADGEDMSMLTNLISWVGYS
jgi:hypothetical protein